MKVENRAKIGMTSEDDPESIILRSVAYLTKTTKNLVGYTQLEEFTGMGKKEIIRHSMELNFAGSVDIISSVRRGPGKYGAVIAITPESTGKVEDIISYKELERIYRSKNIPRLNEMFK